MRPWTRNKGNVEAYLGFYRVGISWRRLSPGLRDITENLMEQSMQHAKGTVVIWGLIG